MKNYDETENKNYWYKYSENIRLIRKAKLESFNKKPKRKQQ